MTHSTQNADLPVNPVVNTVTWSPELELGLDYMDDTHREFVELLAAAANAPDADILTTWQTVVAHTQDHFGREDLWMQDTAFPPGDCHATEHDAILKVMHEGLRRGALGQLGLVRQLAGELGVWFAGHAQSMDNALALYLKEVAYNEATREVGKPYVHPADLPPPVVACAPHDGAPESAADLATDAEIEATLRAALQAPVQAHAEAA